MSEIHEVVKGDIIDLDPIGPGRQEGRFLQTAREMGMNKLNHPQPSESGQQGFPSGVQVSPRRGQNG